MDEFRYAVEMVLSVPVLTLTDEEEHAFIRFYGLPTAKLKCKKAIKLVDFSQYLPQLKYMYRERAEAAGSGGASFSPNRSSSTLQNTILPPRFSGGSTGIRTKSSPSKSVQSTISNSHAQLHLTPNALKSMMENKNKRGADAPPPHVAPPNKKAKKRLDDMVNRLWSKNQSSSSATTTTSAETSNDTLESGSLMGSAGIGTPDVSIGQRAAGNQEQSATKPSEQQEKEERVLEDSSSQDEESMAIDYDESSTDMQDTTVSQEHMFVPEKNAPAVQNSPTVTEEVSPNEDNSINMDASVEEDASTAVPVDEKSTENGVETANSSSFQEKDKIDKNKATCAENEFPENMEGNDASKETTEVTNEATMEDSVTEEENHVPDPTMEDSVTEKENHVPEPTMEDSVAEEEIPVPEPTMEDSVAEEENQAPRPTMEHSLAEEEIPVPEPTMEDSVTEEKNPVPETTMEDAMAEEENPVPEPTMEEHSVTEEENHVSEATIKQSGAEDGNHSADPTTNNSETKKLRADENKDHFPEPTITNKEENHVSKPTVEHHVTEDENNAPEPTMELSVAEDKSHLPEPSAKQTANEDQNYIASPPVEHCVAENKDHLPEPTMEQIANEGEDDVPESTKKQFAAKDENCVPGPTMEHSAAEDKNHLPESTVENCVNEDGDHHSELTKEHCVAENENRVLGSTMVHTEAEDGNHARKEATEYMELNTEKCEEEKPGINIESMDTVDAIDSTDSVDAKEEINDKEDVNESGEIPPVEEVLVKNEKAPGDGVKPVGDSEECVSEGTKTDTKQFEKDQIPKEETSMETEIIVNASEGIGQMLEENNEEVEKVPVQTEKDTTELEKDQNRSKQEENSMETEIIVNCSEGIGQVLEENNEEVEKVPVQTDKDTTELEKDQNRSKQEETSMETEINVNGFEGIGQMLQQNSEEVSEVPTETSDNNSKSKQNTVSADNAEVVDCHAMEDDTDVMTENKPAQEKVPDPESKHRDACEEKSTSETSEKPAVGLTVTTGKAKENDEVTEESEAITPETEKPNLSDESEAKTESLTANGHVTTDSICDSTVEPAVSSFPDTLKENSDAVEALSPAMEPVNTEKEGDEDNTTEGSEVMDAPNPVIEEEDMEVDKNILSETPISDDNAPVPSATGNSSSSQKENMTKEDETRHEDGNGTDEDSKFSDKLTKDDNIDNESDVVDSATTCEVPNQEGPIPATSDSEENTDKAPEAEKNAIRDQTDDLDTHVSVPSTENMVVAEENNQNEGDSCQDDCTANTDKKDAMEEGTDNKEEISSVEKNDCTSSVQDDAINVQEDIKTVAVEGKVTVTEIVSTVDPDVKPSEEGKDSGDSSELASD